MKEVKPWPGMGPLTPGKPGKHMPLREVEFSPAEVSRICNASSKESLDLAQLWKGFVPRPGSIDASRPKVRGC